MGRCDPEGACGARPGFSALTRRLSRRHPRNGPHDTARTQTRPRIGMLWGDFPWDAPVRKFQKLLSMDAVAEFKSQILFLPAVLLQHIHAAIAGDAVADVNDEIALSQLEETVDGPRFETPSR